MKISRYAAAALGAGLVVAGCAAASHIKALQPPSVKTVGPISLPLTGTLAEASSFQRGLDIDWYAWPGEDVAGGAEQTLSYAKSLHADALSISFPFFEHGTMVRGTDQTPTPAEMGIVLSDARQAGVRVSLRPLLDEKSLGGHKRSRVGWKPSNQRVWFASYQRFLLPYLKVAQRYHVAEFIVGTELTGFSLSPDWRGLDSYARRRYHGALACSENWYKFKDRGCGTAVQTVDAYHAIRVGSLLAGWEHYDAGLPHGLVETEVGIAASKHAPDKPYILSWPGSLDPAVQAHWFTAACQAAAREHLGGIYFWSIGLGTPTSHGPTKASETTWAGGPGARAISRCYAGFEKSKR